MTEAEWLACDDPEKMLGFHQVKFNERKLRLYACACCRRAWGLFEGQGIFNDGASGPFSNGESPREVVATAERYADGTALLALLDIAKQCKVELDRWYDEAQELHAECPYDFADPFSDHVINRLDHFWAVVELASPVFTHSKATEVARLVRSAMAQAGAEEADWPLAEAVEAIDQVGLLRDIFGNPFHPFKIDSAWLTTDGKRLAQTAYDERRLPSGHLDPLRLSVLADALEEAGAEAELVAHLREQGPHVRGCWALDALLAKL